MKAIIVPFKDLFECNKNEASTLTKSNLRRFLPKFDKWNTVLTCACLSSSTAQQAAGHGKIIKEPSNHLDSQLCLNP